MEVWYGTGIGLAICLVIGAGMIGAFYGLGSNTWSATEKIWQGVFALLASIIISIMGAALLRVSKMQEKWRLKLSAALESKQADQQGTWGARLKRFMEKYAMFMLPCITILREGVEAVVFIGGVSLGMPASSIPLPTICGLLGGFLIGYVIYKGGSMAPLQMFLIASTCVLYLVAAGLFSKGVWYLEGYGWDQVIGGDAENLGSGPGSYDITKSVWHVDCCNPAIGGGGGWGIFNAILGWTNSATYGSVISYNVYWIAAIVGFVVMRFKEKRGRYPFMKAQAAPVRERKVSGDTSSTDDIAEKNKFTGRATVVRKESDDSVA